MIILKKQGQIDLLKIAQCWNFFFRPEDEAVYKDFVWTGNSTDWDLMDKLKIWCFFDPNENTCCSGDKDFFKNTVHARCTDVINIPAGHLFRGTDI